MCCVHGPNMRFKNKWSETTSNYQMMVERYPNLKEEVGGSISAMKSPIYLTKNLPGGQLPHMLWCWLVGLLSQKKFENKNSGCQNSSASERIWRQDNYTQLTSCWAMLCTCEDSFPWCQRIWNCHQLIPHAMQFVRQWWQGCLLCRDGG